MNAYILLPLSMSLKWKPYKAKEVFDCKKGVLAT